MNNSPRRAVTVGRAIIHAVIAAMCLSFEVMADEQITTDQIRKIITETDAAAEDRDVSGIGKYLSDRFLKNIEVPSEKWLASVKIDKDQYLAMIAQGWDTVDEYSYERENTVIIIAPDGSSGESHSTLTQTVVINGKTTVSKIREYAHYELEDGRPMITTIQGQMLNGEATPEPRL
jgi:hypothetical protein